MTPCLSRNNQALLHARDAGWTIDDSGLCRRPDGLLQAVYVASDGYLRVSIWLEGKTVSVCVHRLAALLRFGATALFREGIEVRHIDNDQLNNAPLNLALGTSRQNRDDNPREVNKRPLDALALKLRALTVFEALEVVRRVNGGETRTSVAHAFGVSRAAVSRICSGRTYADVTSIAFRPKRSNPCARKLSDAQAREIVIAYRDNPAVSTSELSVKFGIAVTGVSQIIRGLTYCNATADLRAKFAQESEAASHLSGIPFAPRKSPVATGGAQ